MRRGTWTTIRKATVNTSSRLGGGRHLSSRPTKLPRPGWPNVRNVGNFGVRTPCWWQLGLDFSYMARRISEARGG